jgi:hypothetical protein
VRYCNGIRWHDKHAKFHADRFRNPSKIKIITASISEVVLLVLLTGDLQSTPLRWVQVSRCTYQVS